MPTKAVLCTLLLLLGDDACICDVCLYVVFGPFLKSALVSLAKSEFSIQLLLWHPRYFHSYDVPCPSKLGLLDHGIDACSLCPVSDLQVCDLVFPLDAENWSQAAHVEAFQLFQLPSIPSPGLTSIQEAGEDNGPSSLNFRYTLCSRSLTAWLSTWVKNRLKNTGASMYPYFIPFKISKGLDVSRVPENMGSVMSSGKRWISFINLPGQPNFDRIVQRASLLTVSNSSVRSMKIV